MWRRLLVLGALLALPCGGAPPKPCGELVERELWLLVPLGTTSYPLRLVEHMALSEGPSLLCRPEAQPLQDMALQGTVVGPGQQPTHFGSAVPCELYYSSPPGMEAETGIFIVSVIDQACNNATILEASVHFTLFDSTAGLKDPCQPAGQCATVQGLPLVLHLQSRVGNAAQEVYVASFPKHGALFRFIESCEVPIQNATLLQRIRDWDVGEVQRLGAYLAAVSAPPVPQHHLASPPPARVVKPTPPAPSASASPMATGSSTPTRATAVPHTRGMRIMKVESSRQEPNVDTEINDRAKSWVLAQAPACPPITAANPSVSAQLPAAVIYVPALEAADSWDRFAVATTVGDELDAYRQPQDVAVFVVASHPPVAEDIVWRPSSSLPHITLSASAQHPLGEPLTYFLRAKTSATAVWPLYSDQVLAQTAPAAPTPLPSPDIWVKTAELPTEGFTFHYYARDASGLESDWATVTVSHPALSIPPPECASTDRQQTFLGTVGDDLIMDLSPSFTARGGHAALRWVRQPDDENEPGALTPSLDDPAKVKFAPRKVGDHLLLFEVKVSETNASCTFGVRLRIEQAALHVHNLCLVDAPGARVPLKLSLALADPEDRLLVKRFTVGEVRPGRLTDHLGKEDLEKGEKTVKSDKDLQLTLITPRSTSKAVETFQVPFTLFTTTAGADGGYPVNVTVHILSSADTFVDVYAHHWARHPLQFPAMLSAADMTQALRVEVQPHENTPIQVMVPGEGGQEVLDPSKATEIDPGNTMLVPTDDSTEIAVPFKLVSPALESCLRRGKGAPGSKPARVVLRRHIPQLQLVLYKESPETASCAQQHSIPVGSAAELTVRTSLMESTVPDAIVVPPSKFLFNFTSSGSWTLDGDALPSYIESKTGVLKVGFKAGDYDGVETLEVVARDEEGTAVKCKAAMTVVGGLKTSASEPLDYTSILIGILLGLLLVLVALIYLRRGVLFGHSTGYQATAASEVEGDAQDMEMGLIPLEAVGESPSAASNPTDKPKVPPLPLRRVLDAAEKPLLKTTAQAKHKAAKKKAEDDGSENDEEEGWDAWSNDDDEDEDEWGTTTKKGKSPVMKAKPAPSKVGKAD